MTDFNLYRYCGNLPVFDVDPTGEARLSFTTVNLPKPGECGEVIEPWATKWRLSPMSKVGGFIVQYVAVSAQVKDCNDKEVKIDTSGWPLWEAWRVLRFSDETTPGKIDDEFQISRGGECTKGKIAIMGIAEFYEGLRVLPQEFKVRANSRAGLLPSTQNMPGISRGRRESVFGSAFKTMIIEWNCCPKGHIEKSHIGVF